MKDLHYQNWLKVSALGLGILGFMGGTVIAQVPPDVVIESEPTGGATTTTTDTGDRRFVCQMEQGRYTVMYQPESQTGEMYAWAVPQSMGGGWTAERRCNEVARRLEMYRGEGLVELTTGRENNYDIVCVTTEANNDCQIVFTVPTGQNAIATRDSVFENLASADDGLQTQGVNTYTNTGNSNGILGQLQSIFGGGQMPTSQAGYRRSSGINLKPFLAPTDGGTGEMLRGGNPNRPAGRSLNPSIFR